MKSDNTTIECHPWKPFLPQNARLLLLGSFPPPRIRWSMDFYYPNITNDFWKIMGYLFFNDTTHFLLQETRGFDRPRIMQFLHEKGIAMYDAANAVRRKRGNASDQHLEIIETADIHSLLAEIPACHTIAVTGEKAAQAILKPFGAETPPIGKQIFLPSLAGGTNVWRMPSTSRAYPLALEKKATYYRELMLAAGITLEQ